MVRKRSLLSKLLIIFIGVIIIQAVVAVMLTFALGVIDRQYTEAYNSINFIVNQKAEELETMFNEMSGDLWNISMRYGSAVNAYLDQKGLTPKSIEGNREELEVLLADKSLELINFLYANPDASGIFIIYSTKPVSDKSGDIPALYIRRRTSEANFYSTENYWVLRYGSQSAAKELNIQLDYLWSYHFKVEGGNADFFNKPFLAAQEGYFSKDSHYISEPMKLSERDIEVVMQTVPLVDKAGEPYGILGVEISRESIAKKLSELELPGINTSFYALTDNTESEFGNLFVESAGFAGVFLGRDDIISAPVNEEMQIYEYFCKAYPNYDMLASHSEIRIYNKGSPFIGERRVLYGFVQKSELLANSDLMRNLIIYIGVVFLIISLTAAVISSISITNPLLKLSDELSKIDSDEPVFLAPTGILEIDRLISALGMMSSKVIQSASRLSSIIDLFEKPIAGFEEDINGNRVYITSSMFRVLDMPRNYRYFMSIEEWSDFKAKFSTIPVEGYLDVYKYETHTGAYKYIQLSEKREGNKVYGLITDITSELCQKQKLEYERDVDGLTKLLNRMAFYKKSAEHIEKHRNKVGAAIFTDLDNLKFINDNYGHDYGDEYITTMADSLAEFEKYGGIVSRISGDEFSVFICGYDTEEQIRNIIKEIFTLNKEKYITLPGNSFYKLRASAGIAWYPRDSSDLTTLIKYADFAMYEVKHSNKGDIKEFNLASYKQNSYLTDKLEMLNTFIEDELLYFAFQPIVNAHTGKIFAYEALMRSNHIELNSSEQILQLCKAQSKLYQLERLVVTNVLNFVDIHGDDLGGKKIFFNTMSSVMLTDSDYQQIDKYKDKNVLSKLVLEITEVENGASKENLIKINKMRELGMQVAVDDFGSGYSNDLTLITTTPDYVKIDMNIIRNIHLDNNKRCVVQRVMAYSAERDIKVIAEGVEIVEELYALKELGVDYFQGFLLYRPTPILVDDDNDVVDLIRNTSRLEKEPTS